MKNKWINVCLPLLFAAAIAAWVAGCSKSPPDGASPEKTLYTCGMHPQVIQDHPGNCPICHMKLTPVRKSRDAAVTNAADDSAIVIDAVTAQNMNLRTVIVTNGPLRKSIRTVGLIQHSEAATAVVNTKFKGWVEKLYVDTTGRHVDRGEPLFEIYSPELYSAQTEYVVAVASSNSLKTLKDSARLKLKFLDISDDQINELERTRQPRKTLAVTAPMSGYIMEKMVVQGQMVEAGMKLYEIVNHDTVWVQGQVYEQDLPFVRLGQPAVVTTRSQPGTEFDGRVGFIYPTFDEKTRTATVRTELANPDHALKPGMFATVQISAELSPSALLVPDSAVLRSGDRNIVFVALDNRRFEPRVVQLGAAGENNMDQVLSGLTEGERIVTSGQFMLDSESQLREAIQKMRNPAAAPSNRPPSSGTHLHAEAVRGPDLPVLYACPMHSEVVSDKPGKCPECLMDLQLTSELGDGPAAEENWRRQHPPGHQH